MSGTPTTEAPPTTFASLRSACRTNVSNLVRRMRNSLGPLSDKGLELGLILYAMKRLTPIRNLASYNNLAPE